MTFDEKLKEIRRLLAEAYEHALAIDGHCKSSEGAIQITKSYPPFFWREGGWEDREPDGPSISIYSYVLGPNRMHYFDSADEALAVVRAWHAKEMCPAEYDEDEDCGCYEHAGAYWESADRDLKMR